jgi:uncharacterized protein
LTAREPEILDVSTVAVRGRVDADGGIYCLNFAADYTLTMPSCRSLTPVEVPMTCNVSEIFTTQEYFDTHKSDLDADMFFVLDRDIIDLDESVADNILLEIPMRVLTEEEKAQKICPLDRLGKFSLKKTIWQCKHKKIQKLRKNHLFLNSMVYLNKQHCI